MSVFDAPWREEVESARSMQDLNDVWAKYGTGAPPEVIRELQNDLQVRQIELENEQPPTPVSQYMTSLERLAQIETQSYEAQEAYREALERFAKGHTAFKTLRAKTYVRFRPDFKSAADTDMHTDADDAVAAARLEAYLAEGLVKAAKSNLDRLEREFQYHRSLVVNERKVDARPGA